MEIAPSRAIELKHLANRKSLPITPRASSGPLTPGSQAAHTEARSELLTVVKRGLVQEVEFRVLGPFEVLVEGRAFELTRPKQRSLLALLLLHAGEVVSTDRLVEELWAGRPPKAAVGSLQNVVSDLRKALSPEVVATRSPGYMLGVDPERVDLHRFQRLVAQASEGGEAERRSALLREALALWRGPPLAELAFEPFAHIEIARLEEMRTAAREELIEAELQLGRHSPLVGELETLVTEHPLRERLRGQLMLALYRSGRQVEALEAYRQARETLVDELGIEPSPDLQRLEQSILRHDRELDFVEKAAPAVAPPVERRKTVTILFTDIVDSTSLGAQLDPEVLRSIMRRYFDTVRTIVERHDGTVEKFIGDAAMAVFGVPQRHEDDALRAARASCELRDALVGLNAELEREHGLAIQIRTGDQHRRGAHRRRGFGSTVCNRCRGHGSRAPSAGRPPRRDSARRAHALLSSATSRRPSPEEPSMPAGLLGPLQTFRLLALEETSGHPSPHRRRLSLGGVPSSPACGAPSIPCRTTGRSRVVIILGEAGVGKTRLTSEFASSLGKQANTLVGRCVSYGEGATYLPLATIVRQAAPIQTQTAIAELLGNDERAPLIAARMTELAGQTEGAAPTGELFWAVRRFLEALAAERPLVLSTRGRPLGRADAARPRSSTCARGSRMRPSSSSASRGESSPRSVRAGSRARRRSRSNGSPAAKPKTSSANYLERPSFPKQHARESSTWPRGTRSSSSNC